MSIEHGDAVANLLRKMPDEGAEVLHLRNVGTSERKNLASEGKAMSDGSYPIANESDLRNAIQAFGRAPEEKRAAVKSHIKKRARALGKTDLLPDDWD